ncbi:MAG: hypothetical protein N3I86_08350 [Verrucomicrobiae bacterium]|nr:hypothetical protein [Verrucomicrobiae bacterium]MDW8309996.1 hypothetical protein [Verrucomicrobiales bacterium]
MNTRTSFAPVVLLLLVTLNLGLSGCATRDTAARAQLRPAQFLQDAASNPNWTESLNESQAAVAASWRF